MNPSTARVANPGAGVTGRSFPLGQIALLAILYYILGRLGFSISVLKVTPVWPPSGLAIAAVLIYGKRIWPGIWIGAFAVGYLSFHSILPTAGTATGSTLAALLGAFLLNRYAFGLRCLDRATLAFRFVTLGGFVSTLTAAFFGATVLLVTGIIPASAYSAIWFTWWMGDVAGVLVLAPLILSFYNDRVFSFIPQRIVEIALLFLVTLTISLLAFGTLTMIPSQYHAEYMVIPCLVWAAFRFRLRGAATMTALVSCVAIEATIHSHGPFVTGLRNESLLALQVFMGVTAMMALALSAVLNERKENTETMIQAIHEAQEAHIKEVKETQEKQRKTEQMELMSRLVSGLAHEIRSPLFAISAAAQVLEKKAPEEKDYSTLILDQVERLKNLTIDLLELSRPTNAWLMSNYDVRELILKAKKELESSFPEAAGKISILDGKAAITLWGSQEKLVQLFLNVMENAIQHSPAESRCVQVEAAESPSEVLITVCDRGPGIPTENMSHLFEPFFTTRKGGIGLGLIIAKQIVDVHEGRIRAYNNNPGPGCTFEMVFPRPDRKGEPR